MKKVTVIYSLKIQETYEIVVQLYYRKVQF